MSPWLSALISILTPIIWAQEDKIGFIAKLSNIWTLIDSIGAILIVICLLFLYYMSAHHLGPFYVGPETHEPWHSTSVAPSAPAQPAQPAHMAHMTITSASVQQFITDNHLKLTPKDYLPTMKSQGFTCQGNNITYTCSK